MDVLKEASQLGVNLYEEHLKFASSFNSVWKNDENILLLLSAVALFTPVVSMIMDSLGQATELNVMCRSHFLNSKI